MAAAGHNRAARIAVAGSDGIRETHAFGDAADNDWERDDYRGARGHRGDPPAVRGGAPAAGGRAPGGREVHLKLVRAHLAVLEPAGQTEADLIKTVPPPTPEVLAKEAEAGKGIRYWRKLAPFLLTRCPDLLAPSKPKGLMY